jgi:hypothetical protein
MTNSVSGTIQDTQCTKVHTDYIEDARQILIGQPAVDCVTLCLWRLLEASSETCIAHRDLSWAKEPEPTLGIAFPNFIFRIVCPPYFIFVQKFLIASYQSSE